MGKRIALIVAACMLLVSCANMVRVKQSVGGTECMDTKASCRKVPGIPFYVKKVQFKQTTVYMKTWLKATLTVETSEVVSTGASALPPKSSTQIFEKQLHKKDASKLSVIRLAIMGAGGRDAVAACKVITHFVKLPPIIDAECIEPIPVKNAVDAEWVVDGTKMYYLNAPLPWFGSGSLTQDLNENGTLAKVTSTADTKLAESVSALIPFKEYLGEQLGLPVAEGPPAEAVAEATRVLTSSARDGVICSEGAYALSLSVEEIGYEYTCTRIVDSPQPTAPEAIKFNTECKTFSRSNIGSAAKPEEKAEAGPTLGITGSITFPENWDATRPAESKSP